jgi:hypothetical protein
MSKGTPTPSPVPSPVVKTALASATSRTGRAVGIPAVVTVKVRGEPEMSVVKVIVCVGVAVGATPLVMMLARGAMLNCC